MLLQDLIVGGLRCLPWSWSEAAAMAGFTVRLHDFFPHNSRHSLPPRFTRTASIGVTSEATAARVALFLASVNRQL